tara:strand:- start:322 stop:1779 length:1458 start_codon:yes stop_codon:yes gene_type:complete
MAAFDLDEGNWTATPDFPVKLTWRGDAAKTYTDWTIEVHAEDTSGLLVDGERPTSPQIINVHRAVLSQGERASGYFHAQFSLETAETARQKSTIPLPQCCAEAFPAMLDFMYGEKLSLTVDSAVPLMELARRFQLPALGNNIVAHLNIYLNNPKSALIILAHALDLKLEKVVQAALKIVARNFGEGHGELKNDPLISRLLDDDFSKLLQDDELGIWSEDEVCHAVMQRIQTTGARDESSLRALWTCVRVAGLSNRMLVTLLDVPSVPRDIFFAEMILASRLHGPRGRTHPSSSHPSSEALKTLRGHTWANPMDFTVSFCGQLVHVASTPGSPTAVQLLPSLLPGRPETTGMCLNGVPTNAHYHQPRDTPVWIQLELAHCCLLDGISLAGVAMASKAGSSGWDSKSAAGAKVFTLVRGVWQELGQVPEDFESTAGQVHLQFPRMPVKTIRITSATDERSNGKPLGINHIIFRCSAPGFDTGYEIAA